jgi:hypothetical protein
MTLAEKVAPPNRPVIVSGRCEHRVFVAAMTVNAGAR